MICSGSLILLIMLFPSALRASSSSIYPPFPDPDNDNLPTAFESFYGTNPINADTDGDTYPDGIEYILYSDPMNANDTPSIAPGMRVAVFQQWNTVKLCLMFYPGEPSYLDNFGFYMAYDPENFYLIDFTEQVPQMITESSYSYYRGLLVASYIIEFPKSYINSMTPLCFGTKVDILGDHLINIIDLNSTNGRIVKWCPLGSELGVNGYYEFITNDEPIPSEAKLEEVCKTEMEVKQSQDGLTTYVITKADCDPILKKVCVPSECKGQVGKEVITIDPGFLSSESN
jgi:hypothetical protein